MPGMGSKSAERLAFHILKSSKKDAAYLASAIIRLKETVGFCSVCNNLSEGSACEICRDPGRDKSTVCVVEGPNDVIALERAGGYKGVYHVLMGALSPLEGVGPSDIRVAELLNRVKAGGIKEVIIATDCDIDGEITALYIVNTLKPSGVKISQIAYGVPVGSNVEYADQATLAKAMEGRRQI